MPCYLFTYHAHGSWMPDHQRGYVRRGAGIQPRDRYMATLYRQNMKTPAASFDASIQQLIIDEAEQACHAQHYRLHYVATETTHAHVLVSWVIERAWEKVRAKLRESMSRRLNKKFGKREWFAKSPSRRRVANQRHFDYLINVYLPRHRGVKWKEGEGIVSG